MPIHSPFLCWGFQQNKENLGVRTELRFLFQASELSDENQPLWLYYTYRSHPEFDEDVRVQVFFLGTRQGQLRLVDECESPVLEVRDVQPRGEHQFSTAFRLPTRELAAVGVYWCLLSECPASSGLWKESAVVAFEVVGRINF